MIKVLKFFLGLLLMVILMALGALWYFGAVPGLSKPMDLGAKNDPKLFADFNKAHGMKDQTPGGVVPAGRMAEFSGQTELDVNLSSDEITSILAAWRKRSPSLPVKDVQVRFNSDGTGEISGVLEIKTAVNIAKQLGYNDSDIEEGKKYVQYVPGDVIFYAKGTGGMTDNKMFLNPETFKVGRITVPQSITSKVVPVVNNMIEKRINQVGTIHVKSIDFSKGSLHFSGTVPDTVK